MIGLVLKIFNVWTSNPWNGGVYKVHGESWLQVYEKIYVGRYLSLRLNCSLLVNSWKPPILSTSRVCLKPSGLCLISWSISILINSWYMVLTPAFWGSFSNLDSKARWYRLGTQIRVCSKFKFKVGYSLQLGIQLFPKRSQ